MAPGGAFSAALISASYSFVNHFVQLERPAMLFATAYRLVHCQERNLKYNNTLNLVIVRVVCNVALTAFDQRRTTFTLFTPL